MSLYTMFVDTLAVFAISSIVFLAEQMHQTNTILPKQACWRIITISILRMVRGRNLVIVNSLILF